MKPVHKLYKAIMCLNPGSLLSSAAKEKCIANLSELPSLNIRGGKSKRRASVLVPVCVDRGEVPVFRPISPATLNHSKVLLVISAYICTSQALPPCTCTRNYLPVCGSDGETYSNQCVLDCINSNSNKDITAVREGPCEVAPAAELECICTLNYLPVCGNDGNTYPNQCSLECKRKRTAGLEMSHMGSCVDPTTTTEGFVCSCTREKKPVCGSDGVTYSNDCLLNCATAKNHRLSIANYGPCEDKVKVADIKF